MVAESSFPKHFALGSQPAPPKALGQLDRLRRPNRPTGADATVRDPVMMAVTFESGSISDSDSSVDGPGPAGAAGHRTEPARN